MIIIHFLSSCSSNGESEPPINKSLLYGQWFHVGLCTGQNNMVFNSNGTYVHTYSGNTCDNNENDTYRFTGTYTITGNRIAFNQVTEEIIEEGDIINTPITDFTTLIHQKIIVLKENELVIERKFNNGQDFYNNWHFTKQ
jgi:hypothetical protein